MHPKFWRESELKLVQQEDLPIDLVTNLEEDAMKESNLEQSGSTLPIADIFVASVLATG